MVRKVEDLSQPANLQVQARITDTYTRPAAQQGETSLEQIANAFKEVNPALLKFVHNREEEQEQFEVARGIQLYRDLTKDGGDITSEEAKALIAEGKVEGYKHLSRNLRKGYVQGRYERLATSIGAELQAFANTATMKDANGNEVPLAQIQDRSRVSTLIMSKSQEIINNMTGGVKDPVLMQTIVQPKLNEAFNVIFSTQASKFNSEEKLRITQDAKATMDVQVNQQFLDNGELLKNPQTAIPNFSNMLQGKAQELMKAGLTNNEIVAELSAFVQGKLRTCNPENIEGIYKAAMMTPILANTPGVDETLNITKQGAERDADFRLEREQRRKEDNTKRVANELLFRMFDGEDIKAEMKNLIRDNPDVDVAAIVVRNQRALTEASMSTHSMPPETYYNIMTQAMRGQLGRTQIMGLLGSMDPGQQGDLISVLRSNESDMRARISAGRASSRAAASSQIDKEFTAIQKNIKGLMGLSSTKNMDIATKTALKGMSDKAAFYAYAEYQTWRKNNPKNAQDPMESMIMRNNIEGEWATKYMQNIDVYRNDPSRLLKKESPTAIARNDSGKQLEAIIEGVAPKYRAAVESALDTGDTSTIEAAFKKARYTPKNAQGKPQGTSNEIARYAAGIADKYKRNGGSK